MRNEKLLKTIGKNVKYYREEAGHSQEKLAELADVHRNYVARIESGKIDVSVSGLAKLAKGLRLNICDLLAE